jgi:hypothetical protein
MGEFNSFYASLCIDDIAPSKVMKDGKRYICLDDLVTPPYSLYDKTGKHYVGIKVFVNKEKDKFGNMGSVYVKQTKEQYEAKEPRVKIANLRSEDKGSFTPTESRRNDDDNDLPF